MRSLLFTKRYQRLNVSVSFRNFFGPGEIDQNVFPHLETLQKELVAGGAYLSPSVEIDYVPKYDLSLVCRKKIKKFDVIAKIPRKLCTEASSIDELTVNTHKDFIDKTKKTLRPHIKYLKYMYRYGNVPPLPIKWRDELETQSVNAFYPAFEPDEMLKAIREKKTLYREIAAMNKFKPDPFLLNAAIIESRVFHLEEGGLEPAVMALLIETKDTDDLVKAMSSDYEGVIQQYANKIDHEAVNRCEGLDILIPFADFINHSSKRDDALLIFNQTKDEFHLVAMRDISQGNQIFFDYSTRGDPLSLYLQYGIPPGRERHEKSIDAAVDARSEQDVRMDEREINREEQASQEAAAKRVVIEAIAFIAQYRRLDGKGHRFLPM